MLLALRKVLSDEQVATLLDAIRNGRFVSGTATALGPAARVKANLQLPRDSAEATTAAPLLLDMLRANILFELATQPAALTTPRFCRYETGMGYGDHLDSPLAGQPPRLRTDIAVTVSLTDAAEYVGGELVVDTDGVAFRWKGDAGDCLIYPADTLHRVAPVTGGVRTVAVLWIQSMIRDPQQRRILFDLACVQEHLDRTCQPGAHLEVLRRCTLNLIRLWAQP